MNKSKHINNKMNTSHNHLHEPCSQESSFLKARAYLSDLSKPEKEVLMTNLGVGAGKICVENFPDEEDLTTEMRGSRNVLKFKDKIFDPIKCSGMGKVFLRKNIVKDVNNCGKPINILTQDMFEDEHGLPLINTIFIIQYDYDLDKGFITIPENSVLVFAGGSFRNGTVILKNTLMLPAGLDIEHFMSVNIRGNYKEGSLVYLRKHLRLFNGQNWVNIGGPADFTPQDKLEIVNVLKKYVNATLDIVSPFKITITPEKNYIETGEHDIKVSWDYNRLINNQDIRLESGNKYAIYKELNKCVREYTFKGIDTDEPVTIVISTTYKGETVSEAITLTFNQNPGLIIDDELNEDSTNPVTNKTITRIIRQLENNIDSVDEKFENYVDIQEFNEYKTEVNADLSEINQEFNEYKSEINNDLSEIEQTLNNKVDKISGKGLSTNDFTNADKSKLDGIEAGAQRNPDLSGYATTASVNAAVSGKQDKLPNGRTGEVLKWNGNSWQPGADEQGTSEDVAREIRKLSLTKQLNNIQLTYDGQAVGNSVIDEAGSAEPTIVPNRFNEGEYEVATINGTKIYGKDTVGGSGGGLAPSDVVNLIENNLDIGHAGNNTLKLKYGGSFIGYGTPDNTGGGDGDDDDDGLPGDILVYFLATTTSDVPSTPTDGQTEVLGDWVVSAPNHVDGQYIWMSQIYRTNGGTCGNWSTPVMIDDGSSGSSAGSDSDSREFIYARANIENWQTAGIPNPNTNPSQWPSQSGPWYDNPQGVTEDMRFEFYSFKYKTGEDTWSLWQGPYIWSSYGKNGTDGNGVEYIFYAGSSIPTDDPFDWYNDNDSKSGGSDNDGVLFNSDEYIPRGSRWTDNPQDLEPGDTQWVSMRKYRNDVNPQSSEQGDSYWHQYSHPTVWNHYAMDITSAGALDFDNQTMGIPVNQSGNNSAFEEISNAYIYYGAGTITIQNLTCTGLYYGNSSTSMWSSSEINSRVIINGNKVTVRIPENTLTDIVGKTYVLKFEATAANVEPRTGSIKLVGLNTGKDGVGYRLDVGTAVIKAGVGTYVPSSIAPKMIKSDTNSSIAYSASELPSSFDIYYAKDNNTPQKLTSNTVTVDNSITEKLIFQLKHNNVIIDEEVIPIVKDGVDGISATVYNIIPLSSSIAWDNTKTTGEITFNAYRKIGSNQEQLLTNGHFAGSDDPGRVEVVLKGNSSSKTISTTESTGAIYTAGCNESTQYKTVQINLYVGSGNTETQVCSIVIPIVQAGSSGSQTLEKSVFRKRSWSSQTQELTFRDGRTNPENGIYYQDFVEYNGNISRTQDPDYNNWGTYLCISEVTEKVEDIPSDSVHFVKLSYDFAVLADYLIADSGFISALSVNQVTVLDNNNDVVAGMTSGSRLPSDPTIQRNNDGIRIWAGEITNGDLNSAPFTVDSSGHVEATDAKITGDVTATSFSVVDSSDHNKVMMEMTTWGNVSNDIDTTKIDSDTLNKLTSSTPVIVVTDENGNRYILNMLAFNTGGGPGTPVTFYGLTKSNGYVTEHPDNYTFYNGKYYSDESHYVNDYTGYEEVVSLAGFLPFTASNDSHRLLMADDARVTHYRKVRIIDGEKTYPDENVYTIAGVFSELNGTFDQTLRKDYIIREIQGGISNFGATTWYRYPYTNMYSVENTYSEYNVADEQWTEYYNEYGVIHQATINTSPSTISPSNGLTLICPENSDEEPPTLVRASVSNN